jgi:hypothetical protein
MSHGSYDLNLVSKRLILVGDIRSRSWPNIGDSYGTYSIIKTCLHPPSLFILHILTSISIPWLRHGLHHQYEEQRYIGRQQTKRIKIEMYIDKSCRNQGAGGHWQ